MLCFVPQPFKHPASAALLQLPSTRCSRPNVPPLPPPPALQSMYIFKQPSIGGVVVPHQDSTFIHTTPLSCVGLWWALEDATKDNGCLWALPGGAVSFNGRHLERCICPAALSTRWLGLPSYGTGIAPLLHLKPDRGTRTVSA